jgi:hypothetical protein
MKPTGGLSDIQVEQISGLNEQMQVVEDGKVMCGVALLVTFYFLGGGTPDARFRVVRAFERYQAAIGPKLVWGADPKTGTPKRISGTTIADLASWVPSLASDDALDAMFHGGRRKDDASLYTVQILSRSLRPAELSHFSVSLPLEWVASNELAAFTSLVLDLCKLLRPSSGYAGLAAIPHVNASRFDRSLELALGFAARFSGLEIDLPASHSIYMEQKDRIKGVNWLTILDNTWIARLGGLEEVRAGLGPEVELHAYDGGIVIQAGPQPRFGDVNREESMTPYRQVAKTLLPIRIDSIRALALAFGFDEARSNRWLRRFD